MKLKLFLCVLIINYNAIYAQNIVIKSFFELDSLYSSQKSQSQKLRLSGTIFSFGKSRETSLNVLDSLGIIKKRKYKTSLLVTLLNDTVTYYIPVRNKEFKRWYKYLYTKKSPVKAIFTIKVFSKQKIYNSKRFFVVKKIKISEN